MGFYERWILPRLLDLAMRNREVKRYRAKTLPAAAGRVLEIGVGSGLNLPFYGPQVTHLYALDPSPELLRMAGAKRIHARFPVDFLLACAERMPLESASVDTVVSTFTLCSIPDAKVALAEAARVLRPGGSFVFAEHGHAPDAGVAAWQRRIGPYWTRFSGGCHLDRRIDRLLADAGFRFLELDRAYAKGPRILSYIYSGRASPANP